jgi:pyridoxal phosphate enzyme (YggS family)
MPADTDEYRKILMELNGKAQLVAVSKTKTADDILALYAAGQRDFGENYVQELADKQARLPGDIRWHFIGHLQSNKVKQISSFVHLIQGVDSLRLLREIGKQATRGKRTIEVLLQVHIAQEETKFGFDANEIAAAMESPWEGVHIGGLMGMASNTEDGERIRSEFRALRALFDRWFPRGGILSMGMSGDYKMAVEEGSTMVRIGSLLFGRRG